MKEALVSVIIPTYNSEKFIIDTIQSVQNQSYKNWEVILVDGCSTDKTVAIILVMIQNDSRIKLLQLEKNYGTGIARNKGVSNANDKYIYFLGAKQVEKTN